jgi:hypothetical protein
VQALWTARSAAPGAARPTRPRCHLVRQATPQPRQRPAGPQKARRRLRRLERGVARWRQLQACMLLRAAAAAAAPRHEQRSRPAVRARKGGLRLRRTAMEARGLGRPGAGPSCRDPPQPPKSLAKHRAEPGKHSAFCVRAITRRRHVETAPLSPAPASKPPPHPHPACRPSPCGGNSSHQCRATSGTWQGVATPACVNGWRGAWVS